MLSRSRISLLLCVMLMLGACGTTGAMQGPESITHIYLAADSTVADHTLNDDYWTHRHPVTGWGQKFQPFFTGEDIAELNALVKGERVEVVNKAKGGRSTRTFFEEGRWDEIYRALKPGDLVMIQFGHNDAALEKHERYVNIIGYKQYLRLFVQQAREKKVLPILLTPVNRNYPWADGQLGNSHGDYPAAMIEVAEEMNVLLIDLGKLSRDFFSNQGQEFVRTTYFMNLPPKAFPAYPNGLTDNTHFQPAGAEAVARLVFEAMKNLSKE
jgi:lysophospholipase L1-like esterase